MKFFLYVFKNQKFDTAIIKNNNQQKMRWRPRVCWKWLTTMWSNNITKLTVCYQMWKITGDHNFLKTKYIRNNTWPYYYVYLNYTKTGISHKYTKLLFRHHYWLDRLVNFLSISPPHLHHTERIYSSNLGIYSHPGSTNTCVYAMFSPWQYQHLCVCHVGAVAVGALNNPVGAMTISTGIVVGLSALDPSSCDQLYAVSFSISGFGSKECNQIVTWRWPHFFERLHLWEVMKNVLAGWPCVYQLWNITVVGVLCWP